MTKAVLMNDQPDELAQARDELTQVRNDLAQWQRIAEERKGLLEAARRHRDALSNKVEEIDAQLEEARRFISMLQSQQKPEMAGGMVIPPPPVNLEASA